jgi:hypothetical protein
MSENFESIYESSIPNQDFWVEDGISLTGNPNSSPDTIIIGSGNINKFTLTAGDSGTLNLEKTPVTMNETKNNLWKYNEDKILKDIQDYVTSTYGSHYCGHNDAYKDIQTIDLMAAKDLAPGFCQANILKYGSRYGDKDGRNKRDLLKVIHYAMLLLHFDGHYSRKDNGLTEFR